MKTNFTKLGRTTIALVIIAVSLIVIAAIWSAQRVAAQISIPIPPPISQGSSFGMVGIAQGQTARLNVVNATGASNGAQLPCQMDLAFFDGQGDNLKHSRVNNLNPGQAAYVDLDWSEISGASARAEIRATLVTHLPSPPPLGVSQTSIPLWGSCNVIPTVEVFDEETHKTTVILSGPAILGGVVPLPVTTTSSSQ